MIASFLSVLGLIIIIAIVVLIIPIGLIVRSVRRRRGTL